MYSFVIRHLCIALCAHHPKANLFLSPYVWLLRVNFDNLQLSHGHSFFWGEGLFYMKVWKCLNKNVVGVKNVYRLFASRVTLTAVYLLNSCFLSCSWIPFCLAQIFQVGFGNGVWNHGYWSKEFLWQWLSSFSEHKNHWVSVLVKSVDCHAHFLRPVIQ